MLKKNSRRQMIGQSAYRWTFIRILYLRLKRCYCNYNYTLLKPNLRHGMIEVQDIPTTIPVHASYQVLLTMNTSRTGPALLKHIHTSSMIQNNAAFVSTTQNNENNKKTIILLVSELKN